MRYVAGELSGLGLHLVYHCVERRTVYCAWLDTDKKQYMEILRPTSLLPDILMPAKSILVVNHVAYINPMPARPLPNVSALVHRAAKPPIGSK